MAGNENVNGGSRRPFQGLLPPAAEPLPTLGEIFGPGGRIRVRRLRPGYRLAVVRDPQRLPPECRDRLLRLLMDGCRNAFGKDLDAYWGHCGSGFFSGLSVLALAVTDAGDVVGASTARRTDLGDAGLLFLDAAFVVAGHQDRGLTGHITRVLIRDHALRCRRYPLYVATRTASPRVYEALRRAAGPGNTHPAIDRPVPVGFQRLGADITGWLGWGDTFDPGTMKAIDAYAALPTADTEDWLPAPYLLAPQARDAAVNAFFARHLGPRDAFLVIIRLTPGNLALSLARLARTWATRSGPVRAAGRVRR
ncbi:MAG TPA: hypothetical protein VHJ17_21525 [Thermomonospora sp.]|nr:hypothetical protein [Thermomonospora sp.]